ncbi:MAG: esterase/lipase family protein [Gemmatimonadaceae bacterium]
MTRLPLVLVHGYSADAGSFRKWSEELGRRGYDVSTIHVCNYRSLTNEVTIRDVAEGFDRALRVRAGLDTDEPFDAIVHSTGMLVVRSWLTAYAGRRDRLKHLVALAPATFGSPIAHKGRSWLGALFKGNRELGPDFLEAGDKILDGLELGGRYTWDLAHQDMLGPETYYGPTGATPFVFIFCGDSGYTGVSAVANQPGSDGTVRWSGCALNMRKIVLDLSVDPARVGGAGGAGRVNVEPWPNLDIPMIPVAGKNHGTILSAPGKWLVDTVDSALSVSAPEEFDKWLATAEKDSDPTRRKMDEWQQFVIRAVDERGDPVTDYNVQLYSRRGDDEEPIPFAVDVHTYLADSSLRCFHANLTRLAIGDMKSLWIRVIASSGSALVGYTGFGSDKMGDVSSGTSHDGKWDGELDLSSLVGDAQVKFFFPYTTTLVEIRLNREPLPLSGRNEVCWF